MQPGWHPDPWAQAPYRWWDGAQWTSSTTHGPGTTAAGRPVAQIPAYVGAGCAALVMLGSILPWVEFSAALVGSISRSGIDGSGDGWFTLAAAVGLVVLFLLAATQPNQQSLGWGAGALALVPLAIGIYDWWNVHRAIGDFPDDFPGTASVGVGLVVVTLASGAAAVAGFVTATRQRS